MEDDDNEIEVEQKEIPKLAVNANHEAKLKELLYRISSFEIKLYSDATKEFMKLLRSDSGGEFLRYYVRSSSSCSELLDAWKLRSGRPGMSYIFKLISAILSHPDGKYRPNDKERIVISRVLDKFARSLIEEHLQDVYKELNSKEAKCQSAALLLMASIVRRGSGLASEVAKYFDFKLQGFSKLAEFKKKQNEKRVKRPSLRKSLVGFAMSFLEVGKPGLLRWVLQQKEMYSGVLRALGNDDDETVIYVLSTLRDRILVEESLVPPGLRSVLFGSVTLEQLLNISGRENGSAAELAYDVLVLVCTDPCNGLMPDPMRRPSPLRGNPRRLIELMKKLKATEIGYHKKLLLAIVSGRPSFGAAYMEEFPFNLEDYSSPTWLTTVTLAANLVSSVGSGLSFGFLASQSHVPPSFDSQDVQSFMKCLFPRSFSRSVINKGLLHPELLVKHGTLRLLLEVLKLLDFLIGALSEAQNNSYSSNELIQGWASLKQEIQNEVRILLPDPQVLLTLLSSLSSHSKIHELCTKRRANLADLPEHGSRSVKKLKAYNFNNDSDIIVSGISFDKDSASIEDGERVVGTPTTDELDTGKDIMNVIAEVWGLDPCSIPLVEIKDSQTYFLTKLLDSLKIYLQILPTLLDGSFEFFVNLLSKPSTLQTTLQHSLLSLLIEYVGWSPNGIPVRTPTLMYKHLHVFLNLLIFSPIRDIKGKAYGLAQAAMLSTGAFDRNCYEIGSWFLFLPGYDRRISSVGVSRMEALQGLCQVVISFLCDAVSTVGNNLFKYWDIVKQYTCRFTSIEDKFPGFSPLVVCILQKCLRLLDSESETFTLPEKSMISLYVSNTVKYILQTQVDARLLSATIESVLFERLGEPSCIVNRPGEYCEWRPLKNLLLLSQSVSNQRTYSIFSLDRKATTVDSSFGITLDEVKSYLRNGVAGEIDGIAKAFSSSIICTTPEEMLKNFPSVMTISQSLLGVPVSLMTSIFFSEQTLLASVSKLWPEIFLSGLVMAVSDVCCKDRKDDACGIHDCAFFSEKDFDASEAANAAATFSVFLKQAPFHVLFPAIMSIDGPYFMEPMKIRDLLLAKLSEWKTDTSFVSYLRLLLFWVYQLQASYRTKSSANLEQLSEICFILLENLLNQVLVLKAEADYSSTSGILMSSQEILEVAKTIFCHPTVVTTLMSPLGSVEDMVMEKLGDSMDSLISLSRQRVHKLDHYVLNMLVTTSEYLFSLCGDHHFKPKVENDSGRQLVKSFNGLIQIIFQEVRDQFNLCIHKMDLTPLHAFYALHVLIGFISPFELLELVHWMFSRVDLDDLSAWKSCTTSAIYFGFVIAVYAFRNLSNCLVQPRSRRMKYSLLWEMEENSINVNIIEEIYMQVSKFALHFETDYADMCLLEAVYAARKSKYIQFHNFHTFGLVMSRVMMTTPMKMLSHCIYKTSKTKAKLLFLLTDASSLHLSIFGHLLLGIMNKDPLRRGNVMEESQGLALSDDDHIMLLPAALTYLNSTLLKFGEHHLKHFCCIPSFYSRILLNGFLHWKSFVSGDVFREEYGEFFPSSLQELITLVSDSLLGKSIHMLQYHFALNGDSMNLKQRLKLFNSICSRTAKHDELIDCDVGELASYSVNQSLNLINRVVAKILFCRMLLVPNGNQVQFQPKEADGVSKDVPQEMEFNRENSSRIQFINNLVSTWQLIVRKIPFVSDSTNGKSTDRTSIYKYLEAFILRSILELTIKMHNYLIQLESIPFLEQLMKSALICRFEDPSTLKMLQGILTVLSDGKFSRDFYLQLLLAHSQFAPTIHSVSSLSSYSHVGAFLRPMSGILRSLVIPTGHNASDGKVNLETTELYLKRLEVIKLLRILFPSKAHCACDSGKVLGINFKELYFLLLTSYGGKLSEIDMEIYNLMRTIESIDGLVGENVAGLDYLWGSAASKIEKQQVLEQDIPSDIMNGAEAIKERRRSLFRDNLPIDPRICASTVLYFPYDRTSSDEPLSLDKFQSNNLKHSPDVARVERYDPAFILRFSIHSLSAGYIEPMEFACLGLLAITFVSMSSPDGSIRRLAYDTLVGFKNALEKCKKRKDMTRIQLLLTCMQNGITEPWQRIPSVIAIFAAEASLILLDPSHDHCATLSRLLTHSSRLDMRNIPLFKEFFWSSSISFKAERLWMLRLLYVGLNLQDDAQIYIRNSVMENLMSFYTSPLSDNESKELILQVVKKSIKLHKMTAYLVENCGLFSWLSSVLSISNKMHLREEESFILRHLVVVLEVVNGVISSRNIIEWLQKYALEQLMELVSHLYRFLVGGMTLIKENAALVNAILEIMISTLKISLKRKIYQPHFNVSIEGLFQLYEVVNIYDNAKSYPNVEFGLKVILTSAPPITIFSMCFLNFTTICFDQQSQAKLSSFVIWAISSALQADSAEMLQTRESYCCTVIPEGQQSENCLTFKLLRWLTASVILGELVRKPNYLEPNLRSRVKNLQSLLGHGENACRGISQSRFGCEEFLASTIIYLQQLVGADYKVLPSVLSAVTFLLWDSSIFADFFHDHRTLMESLWSKIRCPAEANPAWRWSFYQPWKDPSLELTELQKIEELHACQTLLVIFSNVLGSRPSEFQILSTEDVENFDVFQWEKSVLET
ncbi:uncharacterized protein LOC107431767 isoform X2 [Ziziphus jujuba]|uniref:Uncharacterized protein LOC107431767 isoform X2 n=1 Tax=Ziziphus jujuba TaxID=326968 RepID=A0ABM3I1B6_ZIZJJ|nr:uncharacterized protein LOC107431767 isoform X2 [Ziziphus jujuba]